MQSLSIPLGDHNPRAHTAAEVLAALRGVAVFTAFEPNQEVDGMTIRVVNQGEQDLLTAVLAVDYTLRLFVNDPAAGLDDTDIGGLTEADFTEASFLGYSGALLTGGSWTVSPGEAPTAEYAPQTFTSSANQDPQTVYGYHVTNTATLRLQWFEYFPTPVVIDSAGEYVTVTPRFSAQASQIEVGS